MCIRLLTYTRGATLPDLPSNSLFHSAELFHIYENTPGYDPFYMIAYEEDRPVAKLLAVIRRGCRWLPGSLVNRCEIFEPGDFLDDSVNKPVLFGQMLTHLTYQVLPRCFLIECRNITQSLFAYKEFRENGYFPMNWMRVYNSLHSKAPEVRLSASRKRQINQGLKNGSVVKAAETEEEVKSFITMLKRNYSSKILRHFPDMSFFLQMNRNNIKKEIAKVFIVSYKEKIIGGSVCIFSGQTAYLWFSGGMRKTYKLQYPGVLAVWAAIRYANEKKYPHFEFMDVGVPFRLHGYREFILRFGGKQRSTRRWFKFRWNWLNALATQLYL